VRRGPLEAHHLAQSARPTCTSHLEAGAPPPLAQIPASCTAADLSLAPSLQILYIVGPQMLGAAIIDGGANFGVACVPSPLALPSLQKLTPTLPLARRCAMYRTAKPQDTITMWDIRHNTIAGDVAVTVFIQVRPARARATSEEREQG